MPYAIVKHRSCPAEKPYTVVKRDGGKKVGGCHESRDGAMRQLKAILASEAVRKG